jgi:hypothetical protein
MWASNLPGSKLCAEHIKKESNLSPAWQVQWKRDMKTKTIIQRGDWGLTYLQYMSSPRDSHKGHMGCAEWRKSLWRKSSLNASERTQGPQGDRRNEDFSRQTKKHVQRKMTWFGSLLRIYPSRENLLRRLESGAVWTGGFAQQAESDTRRPQPM